MKLQNLFSGINKKHILKYYLLKFLPSVLCVQLRSVQYLLVLLPVICKIVNEKCRDND